MTDPAPFSDDDFEWFKEVLASDGPSGSVREARRLVATVEQARRERDAEREALEVTSAKCRESIDRVVAERDAAHAVIRRLLDWWTPHYVGGRLDTWYQDNPEGERFENITPAEVDAIRQARATEEASGEVSDDVKWAILDGENMSHVPGAETGGPSHD